MKQSHHMFKNSFLSAAIFTLLLCLLPIASAQAATQTYDLEDVWLLPDISDPWQPARQMTGTFEWSYVPGDFENGSGQFIDLYIPWYGTDFQSLNLIFDLTSIEFVLPGNWHDLGLDLTLFLLQPLSPDQPSAVDTIRSLFEIQQGPIYKGHVVSGSIVPRALLTLDASLTCLPGMGTVPFVTQMTVMMENLYLSQIRQLAGHLDVTLADGTAYLNWRVGYTNVAPGGSFNTSWNQVIPALGSLVGANQFTLVTQDVTPAPFNQPPYPAAGDIVIANCTVTGVAP